MDVGCWKPDQLGPSEWDQLDRLWRRDKARNDPMFAPVLARELARVRDDTCIILAERAGEIRAFWSLHRRPGGWAQPISGPFSDWHGAVRSPDEKICQMELLKHAGIGGMTAHALFPDACHPVREGLERTGAWVTDLSAGIEAFETEQKRLFPKHVKRMASKRAKLEKATGEIEFRFDDPDPAAFDWLIGRKQQQYRATGLHNVLGSDWASKYIRRLRGLEHDRFRCHLSTLRAGGRVIAAEFNMASDTVLHGWLTAYDVEFSGASPGLLLLQDVLRAMPSRGLVRYDCGPGSGHYKHYFSNLSLPLDRGVLRTGPRAPAMALAGTGWRHLEGTMPGGIGEVMARSRRRFDQILLSETRLAGRIGGVLDALRRFGN
ncbi:MAG: GNAT family N-acetyltransferase [Hyphomonas sp.]|uniref:GNAT family N-acetyltransferase n=1 Tax=Hyphomonas sp. TaxID=87 RepID=UPI0035289D0D